MAVPIKMPDLGTTVDEFRIVAWRVREGDTVARGDILAEVETDKAVTELESTASGVVLKLLVPDEALVRTGETLAYVGALGEVLPQETLPDALTAQRLVAAVPLAAQLEKPNGAAARPVAPVVRNLAGKLGVDINALRGSGQGGAITRQDVMRAGREAAATGATAPQETLSRGQTAVAKAVASSWTEKPHAYFTTALQMMAVQRARERCAATGTPVSYDAILLKAMAHALEPFPAMRSVWREGRLLPIEGLHLALAVGLEQELYLPVIRDVDRLSLTALQAEINGVVVRLKAGTLPADRMTGACMALTNLGMFPIDSFNPIIFPEHSAILAAGAVQPTLTAVEGRTEVQPMMKVTLAVDHRVINGRVAAAFLRDLKKHVEAGDFDT
jgi:pyruvate dehydrogenase E2 component (dihydrolipoamide acetyltransferase)